MSLWHDSQGSRKPFFLGETPPSPKIPRRSPGVFYSHRDFAQYQDRIFLAFLRDRLIWLNGMSEDDPIIEKLVDIIHRTPENDNSSIL
jgi:hypothetical protein